MGNTRYYTKANGQSYAELIYDAWGMPESPNKLLNNDHGNYVYATYTGHIFDTTLDIYFCEARFYDANTRTWLAMDPIKEGDNWYQYCNSNPVTYWDPTGLFGFSKYNGCSQLNITGFVDSIRNKINSILNNRRGTITFSLGSSAVAVLGYSEAISISLDMYGNYAIHHITSHTISNEDEAYVGVLGVNLISIGLQATNFKYVTDLNGLAENIGGAYGVTGAYSFDIVDGGIDGTIDGVQASLSLGVAIDIHIIDSNATLIETGKTVDLLKSFKDNAIEWWRNQL